MDHIHLQKKSGAKKTRERKKARNPSQEINDKQYKREQIKLYIRTMTTKRIQSELINLQKDPPANCSAGPVGEDLLNGKLRLWDQKVYHGGVFNLRIDFPQDYPFKPPQVVS